MKGLFFLSLVLALTFFNSCDSDNDITGTCSNSNQSCIQGNGNRILRDFSINSAVTNLQTDATMDFDITRGNEATLEILADDNILDQLVVSVQGATLNISTPDCYCTNLPVRAFLTLPELVNFDLNGVGNYKGDLFDTDQPVNIEMQGVGDFDMGFNAPYIDLTLRGTGNISINGLTDHLRLNIQGVGNFFGRSLQTDTTTINLTGTGNIEIAAQDYLDITSSGVGNICYVGTPQVDADIDGPGLLSMCN